ncbi:MAG: SDR family oxidoreductase [Phycicoccus sp.]|nr:SDR family oxidoreductase [Phycicoccus sp.]
MENCTPLSGRVAWVTGGSSGIGAATCRKLADLGATVGNLDRNAPSDESTPFVEIDIADEASVQAAMGALANLTGPPDILVCSAGISPPGAPLVDLDPQTWRRILDVNLTGSFLCVRSVLPGMMERGFGRIVTVASGAGVRVYPGAGAYAASKAGLISLTKVIAHEGAPHGVTANVVAPGLTDTPMTRALGLDAASLAEAVVSSPVANPMHVVLTAEDQAEAIAWFCLPGSSHVTGQTMHVNGGGWMP